MPKTILKQEFGRRLQAEMIRKGWNQSELARQAGLHLPGKHFGRDLVSNYVRGKILPQPVHLNALCHALGKKPEDLLPPEAMNEPMDAPVRIQEIDANRTLLHINMVVPYPTALAILQLLKGEGANGAG
jgi:transcriptional regulator with XRE-family HTH domain